MNERFKELVAQAGTDVSGKWLSLYNAEALAELIVKECAEIVEGFEITQEVALDEYVDYEASAVLKQHFGVEK